jgi:chromosome partitioning protein
MLVQLSTLRPKSAHVIVLGNEKGGVGKSTIAMHVAIALLNHGQRVATVDLDLRQKSLTHYIENRRIWAKHCRIDLPIPSHFCIPRGCTQDLDDNEAIEFTGFVDALTAIEETHDFIVIDTAGSDSHLTRLAHSMANTLITPLNDSFLDFDVLASIDPASYAVTTESHYASMVREARQQRRLADGMQMDWLVIRNRLSSLDARTNERMAQGLAELGTRLRFRSAEGLAERFMYREFFPRGLTAIDEVNERTHGALPNACHAAARDELMNLVGELNLSLDERSQRRAAAQAEWAARKQAPLDLHEVIAEA